MPNNPTYSLVFPVFNEEAVLPLLFHRLDRVLADLDGPAEVILVDDGSTDCTSIILAARARDDSRYRYIGLSRNFGQQAAMTAGLDAARGEAVILMDADLQDPPEIIHQMIEKWREGYEIVYARRAQRAGESKFKLATARLFYQLMSKLSSVEIPQNTGDFRLVDRKALEVFRSMREQDRFVRGMVAWIGGKQVPLLYDRKARAAGETKYPLSKMIRFAVDAITAFSVVPLMASMTIGWVMAAVGFAFFVYSIVGWAMGHTLPGWTSLMAAIGILGGMQFLMLGVIGAYLGRLYDQSKDRPLFMIRDIVGGPAPGRSPRS